MAITFFEDRGEKRKLERAGHRRVLEGTRKNERQGEGEVLGKFPEIDRRSAIGSSAQLGFCFSELQKDSRMVEGDVIECAGGRRDGGCRGTV